MPWQDVVISIANLASAFALWPSIRSVEKPATRTAAITASALVATTISLLSLGLWISGSLMGFLCSMWFVLVIQGVKRDRAAAAEDQLLRDLEEYQKSSVA